MPPRAAAPDPVVQRARSPMLNAARAAGRAWAGAALLALSACGGGSGGSGTSSDTPAAAPPDSQATLSCTANDKAAAPLGQLVNNTWNAQAAGTAAWRQCLQQRSVAGVLQYGWLWQWPSNTQVVLAYPSVVVGASPWAAGPGNDSRFPRALAATQRLLIGYDLDTSATGAYNLAASFWLIKTPAVKSPPDTTAISAELMVLTGTYGADWTAGQTPQAEVTIDGTTWQLYADRNWADVSGGSTQRWTHIVYLAKVPASKAQYDARKLMADAVARGLLDPSLYIANVELGNEVASGSGSTWVRSFSITAD